MQLTIDRSNSTVTIDGRSHVIDLTQLQPEIVRVSWHDDNGSVSYADGTTTGMGDWQRFKVIVDAWHARDNAMQTRRP